MMDRNQALKEMNTVLRARAMDWEIKMHQAGLFFTYTSVGRLYPVQVALYAQGRETLANVNAYRRLAGMTALNSDKENIIVTWTLNSYHIVRTDDSVKWNDTSRAFDFALFNSKGVAHWDVKVSVNKNQVPDYLEAANILKDCGLTAGAFFKDGKGKLRPDYPHAQLSNADLKNIGAIV